MYLERKIDKELLNWSKDPHRKPLLLRGARQVGKTAAVRELSKQFDYFLEINFEEQKQVHRLFEGDLSPHDLCDNLAVYYNIPVVAGKTLLFFDEIQSCIPAISSLRFFYEKFPELHLIAAGSLLEFAFEGLPSFGVGRVRSLFMYPFSFDEFLLVCGENLLLQTKKSASPEHPFQEAIHIKLLNFLRRFLVLGGMPEVIANYVQGQNLSACQQVLNDLIVSLKADFTKYKKRVPFSRLSEVFTSVVQQTGGKFIYVKAATEANHKQVKEAVDLLIMAGLVIPVTHTSAKRKMLIFDTGIFQRILGLNISELLFEDSFDIVNKGSIAELHVGLELLKSSSCYQQSELYYWHREALNSNAEVDYVIQKHQDIIPIEVKSGKKGKMQSLYLFLKEKKAPYGIRFSLENYSAYGQIRVYPLYTVSDIVSENTNQPLYNGTYSFSD